MMHTCFKLNYSLKASWGVFPSKKNVTIVGILQWNTSILDCSFMNYKGRIVPSVTSHNSKWSTIMSWPWVGTFISLDWISLSYAGVTEPALSPAPSQLSSTHLGGVLGGTQGTDSICSNGQVQLLGGLLKMHWLGCCVPAKGEPWDFSLFFSCG